MPFGIGMPSGMQSSQLPGAQSQSGGTGMGMMGIAPFMAAMGNGGAAAAAKKESVEHQNGAS